jgi:ADP-ribose pyrophosphatase
MEITRENKNIFSGKLLKLNLLKVELPDGKIAIREIVQHRGAVGLWVVNETGDYIFVKQYRKAVEKTLMEIVAGTLEEGETPLACARRELLEETGYNAETIVPLGNIFSAPGFCSEILRLFFARVKGTSPSNQKLDADENIELCVLSPADFENMLGKGEIEDAKTLSAFALAKVKRFI